MPSSLEAKEKVKENTIAEIVKTFKEKICKTMDEYYDAKSDHYSITLIKDAFIQIKIKFILVQLDSALKNAIDFNKERASQTKKEVFEFARGQLLRIDDDFFDSISGNSE